MTVPADQTVDRPAPARSRLWLLEIAVWIALPLLALLFPSRLLLLNEIAILALFALSLDIVIGYAGIVSLGHGAFFGLGAYAAGLLAKAGGGSGLLSEPLVGLVFAAGVGGIAGLSCTVFLLLRGADLTRLMVTLGVALIVQELANRLDWLTGGADGLQGVFCPAPSRACSPSTSLAAPPTFIRSRYCSCCSCSRGA